MKQFLTAILFSSLFYSYAADTNILYSDFLNHKEKKGFASVLRVLVNKADNEISITNPVYFSKAFLQKSYKHL